MDISFIVLIVSFESFVHVSKTGVCRCYINYDILMLNKYKWRITLKCNTSFNKGQQGNSILHRWQLEIIVASCCIDYHWKAYGIMRITVGIV